MENIQERIENFAVRVVKAYSMIIKGKGFDDPAVILGKQFVRSGTSIGANYAESSSAQSKNDFISKREIALKESKEFIYWCKIMIKSEIVPAQKLNSLLDEAEQISRILAASIKTLKNKDI